MMEESVQLRRIPYPYRAMLAVCSDLDGTPDRHLYHEIMRFLNTTQATAMGPGVGLEVGHSIYFDMPPDQFAYWNTDDAGRAMVRAFIHSGHIDCLHSYGDLALRRRDAGRALDELARHDCRLEVWVDHAVAPTNFGADIMQGHGDEQGHEAYHADLTCGYGVRYVWRGRVTSVIGQDVPARLGGLFRARHPVASATTVAKEMAKQVLGRRGNIKYAMHGANRVARMDQLRDGRSVYEFLRSNPHWGGVSSGEIGQRVGEVLTESMLGRLVRRGGVCILYTHVGKIADSCRPLPPSAVCAFRRLAQHYRRGEILVLTTRRALAYVTMRDRIGWTTRHDANVLAIDVQPAARETDLKESLYSRDCSGLTFYVPKRMHVRMTVNGSPIEDLRVNPPDETGRPSVSVGWPRLTFPDV